MSELQLKIRGTDEYLIIDPCDWLSVREVKWDMRNGVAVNRLGVPYDEFVGIPDGMHNMYGHPFDKRRKFLIKRGFTYEFSEYDNCFILKEMDNG